MTTAIDKPVEGVESILANLDAACRILAEARTVRDVKRVRDVAQAAADLLKQQSAGLDAQNHAAELKLRAERKLGDLLAAGGERRGRPKKNSHDESFLPEGIDHNQSHRWQRIALIPNGPFEEFVKDTIKDREELTTEAALRLAQQFVTKEKNAKAQKKAEAEAEESADGGELWRVDGPVDCLEWFAAQPADSVHLVFGSPPYEEARLYLEGGKNLGVSRPTDEWVEWMVEVYRAALRCCTGLVAFVVEGQTKDYAWSGAPFRLGAALLAEGITLRKPPLYFRVGIPGSGGPDWLRNDYEFLVCATRGGRLPWSENTAMGQPCKYEPGGEPSHRTQNGSRVNRSPGYATMEDRNNLGPHRARRKAGRKYKPPEIANPGNVIRCEVGGGNMGDKISHENEAPFPEYLAEFFVRSFCPSGGVVCDPFSGSGTTGAVAVRHHRRFLGCDLRESQVKLSRRRIGKVQKTLPLIGE